MPWLLANSAHEGQFACLPRSPVLLFYATRALYSRGSIALSNPWHQTSKELKVDACIIRERKPDSSSNLEKARRLRCNTRVQKKGENFPKARTTFAYKCFRRWKPNPKGYATLASGTDSPLGISSESSDVVVEKKNLNSVLLEGSAL